MLSLLAHGWKGWRARRMQMPGALAWSYFVIWGMTRFDLGHSAGTKLQGRAGNRVGICALARSGQVCKFLLRNMMGKQRTGGRPKTAVERRRDRLVA
ncbi:hypothetical protein, partial [Lacisediminimonas sp.]|uniref:hypothetical protein n=1 Tax=Lacisediminimonas sp. TaxID=3060582 RepID=UPI00271C3250